MALIKKINQFNLDSNLTGNELILTMDNGITKNMMLDNVKDFILNNDNDLTDLGFITSPNTITQDITLPEDSNVYYYGDLSIASGYTLTIPSGTTLTIIDANQVTTTVTGGTYNNGTATFTNSDNTSFEVSGFYTGSTTLPELGFITSPHIITQDIILPEDYDTYYYGDLIISSDYTLTIPFDTTLEIIDVNQTNIILTGGTYNNGIATFTNSDNTSFEVSGFYTGSTTLPELGFNIIPSEITQDITLPDNSIVYYYGDLNMASGYTLTIPSGTTLEIINPNITFITGDTDNNSVLIGGINNIIDPSTNNSVIIGGVDITGVTSNTVYVPNLNINNLTYGDTFNNLGVDENGNVVISDLFSLSDLGFNITPRASTVINQNIILPENTDVTYPAPLTMDINHTIIVPTDTILIII